MAKEGEVRDIPSFLNFNFRHSLFDIRYSLTGLHAQLAVGLGQRDLFTPRSEPRPSEEILK